MMRGVSASVTASSLVAILALLCACTQEADLGESQRPDPVESASGTTAAGSENAVIGLRESLMAAPLSVTRLYITEEAPPDQDPPSGGVLRLRAQVRADSGNHQARFALAEALRRDRDYTRAEEHYREAIRLRSGHTPSYTGLAKLFITLSRDDDAAEILEAAANAAAPTLELHSLRGTLALSRERYDQAVVSFRAVVDMDPSRDRAHYDLAGALERQGSLSTAISALRRGLAHIPESIELRLRLAEVLAATGDHDQALEQLRQLIEANPLTRAYLASARIQRQRGDMKSAREAVDAGLEIESSYADLIAELGILLVDGGQEEEAIPHLERAISSDPDLLEACSALGLAYERTGDLHRAQLVREHTEHLGDHKEALSALKTSIALDKRDAAAFFAIGDLYTHLGVRPVAAAQALELGLQIVPDNIEALSNLGLVFLRLQQLPRAIETYEKVIALDSTSVSAHTNFASALAVSGQSERAIAAFQRALALKPDLAPAHLGLARLYEKLGRAEEAQAARSELERLGESAMRGAAEAH